MIMRRDDHGEPRERRELAHVSHLVCVDNIEFRCGSLLCERQDTLERLAILLDGSALFLAVEQHQIMAALLEGHGKLPCVLLDSATEAEAGHDHANPHPRPSFHGMLIITYTSCT